MVVVERKVWEMAVVAVETAVERGAAEGGAMEEVSARSELHVAADAIAIAALLRRCKRES